MKGLNLFATPKNKIFLNLHKGAKKHLKRLGCQHVVFGVSRNAKGHLSTFYIPMTDAELEAYQANNGEYINAVHA